MSIQSNHILALTRSIAGTILVMALVVLFLDGCHRTPEEPIISIPEKTTENSKTVISVPGPVASPVVQVETTPLPSHCPPALPAVAPSVERLKQPEPSTPILPTALPQTALPTLPAAPVTHNEPSQVEIVEAVTSRGVNRQDRVPTDVRELFDSSDEQVWAFIKVRNRTEPTHITMIWKRNGRVFSRKTLRVGTSPRWRTWSRISLTGRRTGQWEVEVRSADDHLLKRMPFTVRSASLPIAEG